MRIWKKSILFYLGGCAYMGLELLFRGRTHGSMFLAGGLCFLLIGHLCAVKFQLPVFAQTMVGALIITGVELGFGMLVNRNYAVWDYRNQPGNFLGQICPLFTVLWIPVSLVALGLHSFLDRKITGQIFCPVEFTAWPAEDRR